MGKEPNATVILLVDNLNHVNDNSNFVNVINKFSLAFEARQVLNLHL